MTEKTRKDDETVELSSNKLHETSSFSVGDSDTEPPHFRGQPLPLQLGRYQITKELGRGGMGSVYLATDQQLQREVALKIPNFSQSDNEKAIKRFYREARAAATLTHPNLCPIYDVAEIDDVHCIAMAYIQGRPLSDFISDQKPPDPKLAATIIEKVARAMDEAHQQGILHRDLKPANIMIDRRQEPIVMDFGLACQSDSSAESRITQDGALIGSPAYMSPDQLKGNADALGPASDQYSLGVVLYELLCGSLPYENDSGTITLLYNILSQPPQPLGTMRDDLDDNLIAIVETAMAKNPEDRFPSMLALAQELSNYVNDLPISTRATQNSELKATGDGSNQASTISLSAASTQAVTTQIESPSSTPQPGKRKTVAVVAGLVALPLLAAGFALWIMRPQRPMFPNGGRPGFGANGESSEEARRQFVEHLLNRFDRNNDDQLGRFEIPPPELARMMRGDDNNDGFLDRAELEAMPIPGVGAAPGMGLDNASSPNPPNEQPVDSDEPPFIKPSLPGQQNGEALSRPGMRPNVRPGGPQ